MNRKLLLQVAAPTAVVGALVLGTCLVSAWHIDRLQANVTRALSRHAANLEAAQELEIEVRRLRYRSLLYLIDPVPERLEPIRASHEDVERTMERARQSVSTPEEKALLHAAAEGYRRYRLEMERVRAEADAGRRPTDLGRLMDAHPLSDVVEPCDRLLAVSKQAMAQTAEESGRVGARVSLALLLLGLGGPAGGLLSGYGIARGLSRALARAEQLSAVGQLAAGIAHEVRNPLTAIKMLVEAARQRPGTHALTPEDLAIIHGEIVRLEGTVQGFLDFARPRRPERRRRDLREIVAQAIDLVAVRARQQGVQIERFGDDRPILADVDGDQLCHVLVNLFLNALDVMPQGGRLDVTLEACRDGASVVVADTGPGIVPEMASRLFTPFATTKPTGTGLGLSTSRRIVEDHGGQLRGSNRPGGGAAFCVDLPAGSGIARPGRTS